LSRLDIWAAERLEALNRAGGAEASPAMTAALAAARELAPLTATRPASEQIDCLSAFLVRLMPARWPTRILASRERRARAGDLGMLP